MAELQYPNQKITVNAGCSLIPQLHSLSIKYRVENGSQHITNPNTMMAIVTVALLSLPRLFRNFRRWRSFLSNASEAGFGELPRLSNVFELDDLIILAANTVNFCLILGGVSLWFSTVTTDPFVLF